jgi:hypothetical protein
MLGQTVAQSVRTKNFRSAPMKKCSHCTPMMHGVAWRLVTDVSGKHTGSLFEDLTLNTELTCPEMSVTNYQPMLCNIPEGQRPQLHCSVGLKSCIVQEVTNFQLPHLSALLDFA